MSTHAEAVALIRRSSILRRTSWTLLSTSVLVPSVNVPGVGEVTSSDAVLALGVLAARDANPNRTWPGVALGAVLSALQAARRQAPSKRGLSLNKLQVIGYSK